MTPKIILSITLITLVPTMHAGKDARAVQPYSRTKTILAGFLGALHFLDNAGNAHANAPCTQPVDGLSLCPSDNLLINPTLPWMNIPEPAHQVCAQTQTAQEYQLLCQACPESYAVALCNEANGNCTDAVACTSYANIQALRHCAPKDKPQLWTNEEGLVIKCPNRSPMTWQDWLAQTRVSAPENSGFSNLILAVLGMGAAFGAMLELKYRDMRGLRVGRPGAMQN